jgi:hypothetical protein
MTKSIYMLLGVRITLRYKHKRPWEGARLTCRYEILIVRFKLTM